jgi:hypothetical protein
MPKRNTLSKIKFYTLSVLIFPAFLYQCTERERSNPLDPLNPFTGGRPAAPRVISFQDTVLLSWTPLQLSSITRYNLYRRLAHEINYTQIASLPTGIFEYMDMGAAYDTVRSYRLSASTANFESPLSDSVLIRPGPSYIWAIDFDNGEVVKLTHDGVHEIFRAGTFLRPLNLDVNPQDHTAWVVDPIMQEVTKFTGNSRQENRIFVGRGISDIVVDTTDGSFWTLQADSGVVAHYSSSGEILSRVTRFQNPYALALHQKTRRAWVLDKGRGEIYEVDDFSIQLRFAGYESALDIAVDSNANKLWVAASDAVVLADLELLQTQRTEGFRFLARVAVNEKTGECWAADWLERFGNSNIIKLSSDGQVDFSLGGFAEPKSLSVNFFNGHCFIAEPEIREFIELDATGQIVSAIRTRGAFSRIVVENF